MKTMSEEFDAVDYNYYDQDNYDNPDDDYN